MTKPTLRPGDRITPENARLLKVGDILKIDLRYLYRADDSNSFENDVDQVLHILNGSKK